MSHSEKKLAVLTKTTNFVHSTANIWRPKLYSVITSSLLCDNILRNFSYKVGMWILCAEVGILAGVFLGVVELQMCKRVN